MCNNEPAHINVCGDWLPIWQGGTTVGRIMTIEEYKSFKKGFILVSSNNKPQEKTNEK